VSGTRPEPPDLASLLMRVGQMSDGDAKLGALAGAFEHSPFHFHRLFAKTVGETPKRYVERLRLERAAYRLAITDDSVLDVALSVGFGGHETFSRAFRRVIGHSPSGYRKAAKAAQRQRMERNRAFRGDGCLLSEVRFEETRPAWLVAMRRVGAYAGFDPAEGERTWRELEDWARSHGVACAPMRLGLFPDDPGMTAPALQQSDICIPIEQPVPGNARIRCIELAGGAYGVIEHMGPYRTVDQAYRNLADGIRRSGRYGFREGPPVHIYHLFQPGPDDASHAEIRFAVKRAR
jgi:AraC family transcriptional regulator